MISKNDIGLLAAETVVYDDCFIETSNDMDSGVSTRLERLLALAKGKRVLHIGCCDHIGLIDEKIAKRTWLHGLLLESAEECLGIDIDSEAINYVKSLGYDGVYCCDILEDYPEELKGHHFDLVILGEIVEHLDSPVEFLRALHSRIDYNYELIVTVPNAFTLENFINVLGHFERVNSDHRAWYTSYTISKVLSRGGYHVKAIDYAFRSEPNGYVGSSELMKRLYAHPEYRDVLIVRAGASTDKCQVSAHWDTSDNGAFLNAREEINVVLNCQLQMASVRAEYEAAVADRDKGYAEAAEAWRRYNEMVADRDKGYAEAAEAWRRYNEVVADRDKGYAEAAEAKRRYNEMVVARDECKRQLVELSEERNRFSQQLEEITCSRSWRLLCYLKKLIGKGR